MHNQKTSSYFIYLGLSLPFLFLYGLSLDDPFFWDTVQLASKQAHFFYDSIGQHATLAESINSGHIPAFGWYLASCWKIFAKSLLVSHLAMLPFLLVFLFYVIKLCEHLFNDHWKWVAFLFLIYEPTFLAQSSLVSPDIVLMAFLAMASYGLLLNKRLLIGIAAVFLTLVSMRGIMVVAILMLTFLWLRKSWKSYRGLWELFTLFAPAALVFLGYYGFHFIKEGWVFYHDSSPWAESFEKVSIKGISKNLGIVAWRFMDFGRWPIVLLLPLFMLFRKIKPQWYPLLFRLCYLSIAIIVGITVFYKGLTAHRYFMPIYFYSILLFVGFVSQLGILKSLKHGLLALVFLSFITGHFWKYPNDVAQGWDASLAYKDHMEGMELSKTYLRKHGIPLSAVGTHFPFLASQEILYLNENQASFSKMDLDKQQYVLYSNICNDISDDQLSEIRAHWTPIFTFAKRAVEFSLYEKK